MGGKQPIFWQLCHLSTGFLPSTEADFKPMQKVQNTAARLILRAPRHQICTPLH